jgi:hypothetical protein
MGTFTSWTKVGGGTSSMGGVETTTMMTSG